ncbi:MAG: hypothetical protein ACRENV_04035 [Candidatus Dormibacteria bacterium]
MTPAAAARWVRWGLAGLWILDGCLQLQPAMMTANFADNVLYANALMYQPQPLQGWLLALVRVGTAHTAALSVTAAVVQIAIGLGILYRPSRRAALIFSVAWALLVWVGGEGLGALATGTALLESGAPGSALLYALLAVVVWPVERPGARSAAGLGLLSDRGVAWAWTGLWVMGALLHLQPRFPTGAVLAYNLQSAAQDQPGGLAALDYHLARLANGHGLEVALALGLTELLLAAGVWRWGLRRPTLRLAFALTIGFWILAQALGGLASGLAPDPGTAPAVLLLGLALYPARPADRPLALPSSSETAPAWAKGCPGSRPANG